MTDSDDRINRLLEALDSLTNVTLIRAKIEADSMAATSGSSKAFRDSTGAVNEYLKGVKSKTALEKAQADAAKQLADAKKLETDAINKSISVISKFSSIMSSTILNTERNFEKYGKSIDGLGDSALNFGKQLGIAGFAVGAFVKGLTFLVASSAKQADNLLKSSDQLSKIGNAGSTTVSELMDLAHGAGVTSKNLDVLVKPITGLGTNITSLGRNAGEGAEEFIKLNSILPAQREKYQRLGVSQEDLVKNTADYVSIQAMSGRSLKSELRDKEKLKNASLEYTDNLLALATATGRDVESIKKKQLEAGQAVEWQVTQIKAETAARKLEAAGKYEEAALVRKESKGRQQGLEALAGMNDDLMKGAREFVATGTITSEQAQGLARLGMVDDLQRYKDAIANGADAQKEAAKLYDIFNKKIIESTETVGFAASRSEAAGKAFLSTTGNLTDAAAKRDVSVEKEEAAAKKRQEEAGKPGKDPAQDARAKLTTLEIELSVAIDKLLAHFNPFLEGWNLKTGFAAAATVALAAAATAAAIALGKIALGNLGLPGGAGKGGAGKGGAQKKYPKGTIIDGKNVGGRYMSKAAAAAAEAETKAAKMATMKAAGKGLVKKIPLIGTIASAGMLASDMSDNAHAVKEGKITEKEATTNNRVGIGRAIGSAVGGLAGVIGGGGIGSAALGVGGYMAGGELGELLAKKLDAFLDDPKKVDADKKEEEATKKQTEATKDSTKALTELKETLKQSKPDIKPNIKPDIKPNIKPDIKPDTKPNIKPGSSFNGFDKEIDSHISNASKKFGMDEKAMRGFVKMEGGWKGDMSPTGAIGAGQFIQSTWNSLAKTKEGKEIGMTPVTKENFRTKDDPRFNQEINLMATALLAKDNAKILKAAGLEANTQNLYMLHNIGPGVIPALQGSDNVSKETILAMQQNGMKKDQSPSEFVKMQKGKFDKQYALANAETDKISAALGGITSGPTSGYPATLHGNEVISPLEPNSILEKLAKTSIQQADTILSATSSVSPVTTVVNDSMQELIAMQADMMNLFSEKFDTMIDKLGTGNDIQDKMLKHVRV